MSNHPINDPTFKGYWSEKDRKHPLSHGSVRCDTMDLTTPVIVEVVGKPDMIQVAKEYGNFIAFHVTWVLPHLNCFRGYDCTEVVVKKV